MKPPEEQLIDNENRIALMATQICAAYISKTSSLTPSGDRDIEVHSKWAVALAKAIQKEAGK